MLTNRLSLVLLGAALLCAGLTLVLLAGDPRQMLLMRRTLWLSLGTSVLSVPWGALLAFLFVRTDLPGRRAGLVLLTAMLLMPLYLHAAAWDAGFGQLGWGSWSLGIVPLLKGFWAALWIHVLAAIPWAAMIVGVGLRYVDPELEEEALLAGSPMQVALRVTLPRMLAAMAVATLWCALAVAAEMTVTDLYRVRTFAEELYTGFALGDELASAWQTILPALTAGMALALCTLVIGSAAVPSLETTARKCLTCRLGAARIPGALLAAILLGLLAGVPLGNLVYKAGLEATPTADGLLHGWSATRFVAVVGPCLREYQDEFVWTAVIGGAAASVAVAVGAGLAWLARRGGWRAVPALTVVTLGLALPGPLIGLAVIGLLNRPECSVCVWLYDRTILAPVLAGAIRVLPPAVLFCGFVLRSLPDDVLDQAAVDGANAWTRFWFVAVPQRRVGLAAAWLAMFILAAGDLAGSVLVVPPGVSTLPIRIFGLIHAGVDDQVAGVCLTIICGVGVAAAMLMFLLQRFSRATMHRGSAD